MFETLVEFDEDDSTLKENPESQKSEMKVSKIPTLK